MKDEFPRVTQNPCGHQTKHTNRVGCCASCKHLFSSDSAFDRHRTAGKCHHPANRGLVAKRAKQGADQVHARAAFAKPVQLTNAESAARARKKLEAQS